MPHSISVLILDGRDYEMLKVLRCLGQTSRIKTHILSRKHRPMAKFSRYCRKCHYHTSKNDTEWIEAIKEIVDKEKIDVLMPITMTGIEFVSRNCSSLKKIAAVPPNPKYKQLKITQDKWSFYCFVKELGLPISPTILLADGTNIISEPAALDSIEFPALLKPTQDMGGRGIIKIDKRSDFYSTIEKKKALQPGQRYIVQSYIPGEDLSLGVCCKQGKILSYVLHKDLSPTNNSFSHQKVIEYVHNDMTIEICSKLLSSMVWNGMAFIDLRIDKRDNTMKLLEVNPRLGRAFLGALTAGVNFPLNLCFSAMGLKISDKQNEDVRYAHPSAYFNILMNRIIGKQIPLKIRWWESGLRFICSDPLPETFDVLGRSAKWINHFILRRRPHSDNCRN